MPLNKKLLDLLKFYPRISVHFNTNQAVFNIYTLNFLSVFHLIMNVAEQGEKIL